MKVGTGVQQSINL